MSRQSGIATVVLVSGGVPTTLPSHIQEALALQGFTADAGQVAAVTDPGLTAYCGLGSEPNRDSLRTAFAALPLQRGSRVSVSVSLLSEPHRELEVAAVAELIEAGFDHVADGLTRLQRDWCEGEAAAVQRARDWTSAPGAELPPEVFAEVAVRTAQEAGLTVSVLTESELEAARFGAILAVGQGSRYPPRLVDVRYEPAISHGSVALVGKGITFDTGGLSLKSPDAMASMRMDKVGAATILAVMSVLPALGVSMRVRALLPLAENMIGPAAVRPGDVVRGRSGVPISIVDTDFEGRVLLSDALTYAAEESPDLIVDVAALTYQVVVALGSDIGGLFSSDDRLARRLVEAGSASGEDLWRLPLARRYRGQVCTENGVKNHPETDVGRAITAALFLSEFVPEGLPWAHLDITGPAWRGPASGAGATGFGVRTLLRFLQDGPLV